MVMKKCFRILLTCILALSFSIGVSYAQEADITELKTDVDTNKQKTSDNNSKIQTLEQKVVTVEEKVAVTEH
jgi:putative cell wall-binding protein